MTLASIDDIETTLLARAPDASVEDLSKIAAAMKAVAETRFTELTARSKIRETRLEFFKSLSAFLVPIVSLLALFGTIVAQNMQVEASRRQLEDTEWRDLLGSLKNPSEMVYSDPTVAPRLRSFFASPVYGDQAKAIAGRLMGHISNPDGFKDLFAAVFGEVNAKSVDSVLAIGRELYASQQSLQGQCNDMMIAAKVPYDRDLNDCGIYIDEAKAADLINRLKAPSQILAMRRSDDQIYRENDFVDYRLSTYVRSNYRLPRTHRQNDGLDLSGLKFVAVDFVGIDFTNFNFAGTLFDTVDFGGAILDPRVATQNDAAFAEQPDFRGSTWWEASHVEGSLLHFLMDNYYPYNWQDTRYPTGYKITQEAYLMKITTLCRKAGIVCQPPFKFGASAHN